MSVEKNKGTHTYKHKIQKWF